MKGKWGLVIILLVPSFILLSASISYSRTWYVKPDGTGDAPTIKAAIDSSMAGDTVLVALGTYTIESRIRCTGKSNLTILSEEGPENTDIVGSGSNVSFDIPGLSNFILKGFTISKCPIYVYWCSDVIIENNILKSGAPLILEAGGGHEIRDNLIYSCEIGIDCSDYCMDVKIYNNTIAYCHSSYGWPAGSGICLGAGSYTIYNNIITNNTYGIVSISTTVYLDCNNVWGNTENNYDLTFFPDPTGTNGNISLDPQFCGDDPLESSNFYLQSDSPCAPGNHPDGYDCSLIGKYSVGCGSTSVREASWGKIKSIFK